MTHHNLSTNRVRVNRLKLGLSQLELAERAGISRTAVTAIEGNKLVPSVAAAIALSRALKASVEDLFGRPTDSNETEVWESPPLSGYSMCWRAEISGRIVQFPTLSSPTTASLPDRWQDNSESGAGIQADETLVIACCDPAAGMMASYFRELTGLRLLALQRSSSQSLEMLRNGLVHMAGIHLSSNDEPEKNSEIVFSKLGSGFRLVRVAKWQEGIALRCSSGFRSVRSAAKSKLRWIGREPGSGSQLCLERILGDRPSPRIIASHHRGVAESIKSGSADAGVCVQLASAEAGLFFLPVQEEAYDLCFPVSIAGDRRIKAFLTMLHSKGYRTLLNNLPGYDSSETGSLWTVNN